jgi:tetratricopeptide (TPR) repeat protein
MERTAAAASGELEARRLLDLGKELLDSGERDRGLKMIETVIAQFPTSRSVFPACLTLGKHYIKANEKIPEAIGYLNRLRVLEPENKLAMGEDREWFLEAMYLMGTAYFQTRQYTRAFPVLRHITTKYPNTLWANQAYYYIGMCHFAQENWTKAIEALSLVGTYVDPDSPTIAFAEAGRRFYVKVEDADFPIMLKISPSTSRSLEVTSPASVWKENEASDWLTSRSTPGMLRAIYSVKPANNGTRDNTAPAKAKDPLPASDSN